MSQLVLSLFSGAEVLDLGFEQEGFTVVHARDILFGGDVRSFCPPAGRFDGVIGGPPCPSHSRLRHQTRASGYEPAEDLVHEYERVVREAEPRWWLMENTRDCWIPEPAPFYSVHSFLYNARWLGMEQSRVRRICFGLKGDTADLRCWMPGEALESPIWQHTVTSHAKPVPIARAPDGSRKPGADLPPRSLGESLELQGLPADYFSKHSPFTMQARRKMVGNAVPLPMARALARAVRCATEEPLTAPTR